MQKCGKKNTTWLQCTLVSVCLKVNVLCLSNSFEHLICDEILKLEKFQYMILIKGRGQTSHVSSFNLVLLHNSF